MAMIDQGFPVLGAIPTSPPYALTHEKVVTNLFMGAIG